MFTMYNSWYANCKIKKKEEKCEERLWSDKKRKKKIARLEFGGFDPSTSSLQWSRVLTARPQKLHCMPLLCLCVIPKLDRVLAPSIREGLNLSRVPFEWF